MSSRPRRHTGPVVAGLVGIRPRTLQYWVAQGPRGCRIGLQDRPTLSPYGMRLSSTESPRNGAARQWGSQRRGAKPQNEEYETRLLDWRVT